MKVSGYCCRCGQCCRKPVVMSVEMLDDKGICKYVRFNDGIATCPFREGKKEPVDGYRYWFRYCKPYPKVKDLIRGMPEKCTYYLEDDE